MKKTVEVVAALIWKICDGEKKMLVCQRPASKSNGLLWEFVGGKVETGETKAQALIRECREELAITVCPQEVYFQVTHEYPDVIVHLTLFHAHIEEGVPQLLEHQDLCWITPWEISRFDFCPADEEILKKICYDYAVEQIPVGQWRHFKGNPYEVIGIAKHSETLEPMVVYRALYGEKEIWTRPAQMWLEWVTRDGKTFPRFTFEGELTS